MSGLKTIMAVIVGYGLVSPATIAAEDLAKSFATCAGRYSAEMEHAWLIDDASAQHFEERRSGFVSLVEATTTQDNAKEILHQRISSKFAHSKLLQVATFNEDDRTSTRARMTASRLLEHCDLLLLGGA